MMMRRTMIIQLAHTFKLDIFLMFTMHGEKLPNQICCATQLLYTQRTLAVMSGSGGKGALVNKTRADLFLVSRHSENSK